MGKFKQTLLTERAYNELKEAKELMEKETGKRSSFTEVVEKFIGRQLSLLKLDKEIKDYILAFKDAMSGNPDTLGIVLFGSVARGDFNKFSDIDIMIITKSNIIECLEYVNEQVKKLEKLHERIIAKGLSLYINPLIVAAGDLDKLNPLYFSILEDSVVLFERENAVSDFFLRLRRIKYKRINTRFGQVITWE